MASPANKPPTYPSAASTLPQCPHLAGRQESYTELVTKLVADLDSVDPRRQRLIAHAHLLVALDVDGTILDANGSICARVVQAIARVRALGVQIVIATGRGIVGALPIAQQLGIRDGWMVCANGALTLRLDATLSKGYAVVTEQTFDPRPAIEVLAAAVPEGIIAVEDAQHGFRVSRPFPAGELIETPTVVDREQLSAFPVARLILRAPGMDLTQFSRLVAQAGLHSVEYAIGWTAWLDVCPPGVTKAAALQRLVAHLGVEPLWTVAVGDGSNDVEMLTWAEVGFAMGNASTLVKAAATFCTGNVQEDGCAAVLEALRKRTPDLPDDNAVFG